MCPQKTRARDAHKNQAARKVSEMHKTEYKSKKIEYEESSAPKISIDDEPVQVSLDSDAGEYNAGELPYRSFKTVKELAEAVVDQRLQTGQDGGA